MLVTGTSLADCRFHLARQCGATRNGGAEFWFARDEREARDVALTALTADPGGRYLFGDGVRVLEHARLAAADPDPAVADVLEVLGPPGKTELGPGVAGLVVSAWTPGAAVLDVVRQAPVPPERACRMLRPLAAAADRAHHRGLLAGVDCPQRIRIGQDGTLVLAFPGPAPTATQREDVYGLGALLFALIVGEWPAPDAAERLPEAVPERLRLVVQLSLGCPGLGEIHTATPLLTAMEQFEAVAAGPPAVRLAPAPPAAPPRPVRTARAGDRHARSVLTAVLAIAVVVLVAGGVTQVSGLFGRAPAGAPEPVSPPPSPVLPRPVPPSPVPSSTTTTTTAAPVPVRPAGVTVYTVTGSPDHPREAARAADGDPATAWSTDQYRQQFPQFVPGVGLLAGFERPLRVREVDVSSPSAGSVVEIRVASSARPALAETTPLATATLVSGTTRIPVPPGAAGAAVLVWLVKLAPGPQGYQSTIQEIAYLGEAGG